MENEFAKNAKSVIANNLYLCLATVKDIKPWITPVYYAFDKDFSFYFVSAKDTQHVQNLLANQHVSVAIYDSTQPAGTGIGVQIEGVASQVKENEVPKVIEILYARRFPDETERKQHDLSPQRFLGDSIFRLFKIVPQHIYTRDTRVTDVDHRIEVDLT